MATPPKKSPQAEPAYPPELIQALADAGLLDDRLDLQKWDRKRGADKADTAMPEGRTVRDQFIAANPMEFAATILRRREGQAQEADAQKAMADMIRQSQGAARDHHSADQAFRMQQEAEQAAAAASQGAGRGGGAGAAPGASGGPPGGVYGPPEVAPYNPFPPDREPAPWELPDWTAAPPPQPQTGPYNPAIPNQPWWHTPGFPPQFGGKTPGKMDSPTGYNPLDPNALAYPGTQGWPGIF